MSTQRHTLVKESWLTHTGLDIEDTHRNGPEPGCTVEELTRAVDDFFGSPRREQSRQAPSPKQQRQKRHEVLAPAQEPQRKGISSKRKLLRKVKSLYIFS